MTNLFRDAPAGPPYVDHERLSEVRSDAQIIGEFLEWLTGGETDYVIARYERSDPWYQPLVPVSGGFEAVLAEYFDISLAGLEQEKRDMLAALRAANSAK